MNVLVSERIKELMQEQGLNQVKHAEKIGVKNCDKCLAVKKERVMRNALWLLADYFCVDIDYLVKSRLLALFQKTRA